MKVNGVQKDLLVPVQPVPADALVFKFPQSLAWFMFGAACISLGFMIFVLAMQILKPSHGSFVIALLGVAMCGLFATLALRSFSRLRDSVAASSDGIWYLPRKGKPTFIAWVDVVSVKANDTKQRLVLADGTGHRSIRLEYQLTNFGKLRDFVIAHTATQTRLSANAANVFHAIWINKIAMLVTASGCLFFAWLSGDNGLPWISLFCIGYACVALGVIAVDPVQVVIGRDAVVVKCIGWERTIDFRGISGVMFKNVNSRGNIWERVVITRQNGKPITLRRFREGSVALHDALQTAWSLACGQDKSGIK